MASKVAKLMNERIPLSVAAILNGLIHVYRWPHKLKLLIRMILNNTMKLWIIVKFDKLIIFVEKKHWCHSVNTAFSIVFQLSLLKWYIFWCCFRKYISPRSVRTRKDTTCYLFHEWKRDRPQKKNSIIVYTEYMYGFTALL